MKLFLLLVGCLTSLSLFAQNANDIEQDVFESLIIENYTISNEIQAFHKSNNNPVYGLSIQLKGHPAEGSSVTSAEINFFYDNDPRRNQKPVFNKDKNYIVAHYPMEAFSNWMEMLKLRNKRKTSLTFNFVSKPYQNILKAYFLLQDDL